jgi:hypothetical protein
MQSVFSTDRFEFPYRYKFPGQASDEVILFIARENESMFWWRRAQVLGIAIMMVIAAGIASWLIEDIYAPMATAAWTLFTFGGFLVLAIGWWWVSDLWKKSIFVLTTKRLAKFIYTTPFNRHTLSLPLEMIVDTGSYTKGYLQAIFRLGTFTARSSASSSGVATDEVGRVNKKYFYLENISMAEDLQHYVSKVLRAARQQPDRLDTFRPFIPHLKGERRKEFMAEFPEYWS